MISQTQLTAAQAARVPGKHGDTPPVPFARLVEAIDDELPHILRRLEYRAAEGRIHPAYAAMRRKDWHQIAAIIRAIARAGQ
ncbi:MAG: hypothetical protein QJR02_07385 [Sinobacteraceae bacterium]|nr:hypothetical protein [Nevskiaceae bacterium]